MCGIVGIKSKNAPEELVKALKKLQNRGQSSCGISVYPNRPKKKIGLVWELEPEVGFLKSSVGIGHVRYPTIGPNKYIDRDAQPFYDDKIFDKPISLAHNGNITNCETLKNELAQNKIKINSTSDGEILLKFFAKELEEEKDIPDAVKNVMKRAEGAYSAVALVGDELIAFKDPHGIRPLVYGNRGKDICFASETAALDKIGYEPVKDLNPGELMIGNDSYDLDNRGKKICMFEYVYFSRPESVLEGKTLYDVRLDLGKRLELGEIPDVVIPVPDTARPAAQGFGEKHGIKVREALIKDRYEKKKRSFIEPTKKGRKRVVENMGFVKSQICDKKIALIDDSIVRGTTSKRIIETIRSLGAKKIDFFSTCPKIQHPCFYGIDFPTSEELIGYGRTEEEIAKIIGADSITYQSIDGLVKAIGLKKEELCMACLTGNYPTNITKEDIIRLGEERRKERK
ncbi:MAG: amidophosphoribosyltransferase [Candidatus Aenigmarchaeota archaeon]|nr:amidophosphoribosyltransferase [Candidatus Aenigmarchaeota archaeon]